MTRLRPCLGLEHHTSGMFSGHHIRRQIILNIPLLVMLTLIIWSSYSLPGFSTTEWLFPFLIILWVNTVKLCQYSVLNYIHPPVLASASSSCISSQLWLANGKAHFDGQISPDLISGFSFKMAPMFFWHVLIFFEHFLIFATKCSRFINPALESTTFLRSSGFFQWRMVFRDKDLNTQCAHSYYSSITARPYQ